jgi:hypothetical protein
LLMWFTGPVGTPVRSGVPLKKEKKWKVRQAW